MKSPTFYGVDDRDVHLTELVPTLVEFEERQRFRSSDSKEKAKPFRFRPLKADRRFLVVRGDWAPLRAKEFNELIPLASKDSPEWKLGMQRLEALEAKHPRPKSLVDNRGVVYVDTEFNVPDEDRFTRDEGLAAVAEWNRKVVERAGGPDGVMNQWWALLVELGETPAMPLVQATVARNGVGVAHESLERPVLRVEPTAAEHRRHAIPAMVARKRRSKRQRVAR